MVRMKPMDGVRVKAETSTSSCYGSFTFTEQHRPVLGLLRDPMWECSMCRGGTRAILKRNLTYRIWNAVTRSNQEVKGIHFFLIATALNLEHLSRVQFWMLIDGRREEWSGC